MPRKKKLVEYSDGAYAESKRIGGKTYFKYLESRTKTQAKHDQATMRKRGYLARIVPRTITVQRFPDNRKIKVKIYTVWVRRKK